LCAVTPRFQMTTAAANCLPLANRGYGDLEANNNGALHAHERAPPGGASYGTASTEKLAPRRRLAVTCIAACGVALLTVLVALVAWLGVLVSAAQRTLNALQVRTPRGVHAPARYTRSEQVNCAVGVCEGAVRLLCGSELSPKVEALSCVPVRSRFSRLPS